MGQWTPHFRETKAGAGFDRRELVDGEVTDNEVGTNVFPILFRIYRYPRFAQRITGASSTVVRGGALAISKNGTARQVWLQHP